MQKLVLLLAVTFFSVFGMGINAQTNNAQFALEYMQKTKDRLLNDVKGLSEQQLNWKATDSSWSIANCIEHITASEKALFDMVQGVLQQPADPSKKGEVKHTDEGIIKIITDRSFKAKAPEALRPSGQFGNVAETLATYEERRDSLMNFTKTTTADLRSHYLDFPFGKIDAYQGLLFIAAHSERHTLQIEEVKANPAFPKS
ncbi:DinB family protein [Foetidibacter luteolus]|uniref:DinB family protein n=1 Tax=Foetidibacter luteolus TaxID=2608880 RepID=UPI00129B3A37|nr:DinB family protein [Foetidibacter luteolus]